MRNNVSSSPARDRAGGPGMPATLLIVLILILGELRPLTYLLRAWKDWLQNNLIKIKVQIYLPALATTSLNKEQKLDGFILFRNLIPDTSIMAL